MAVAFVRRCRDRRVLERGAQRNRGRTWSRGRSACPADGAAHGMRSAKDAHAVGLPGGGRLRRSGRFLRGRRSAG